jgi:hypothetical protein
MYHWEIGRMARAVFRHKKGWLARNPFDRS